MKKIIIFITFLTLISSGVKSQNVNQVSTRLSFNQFEIGYQRTFIQQKFWGEAFIGLANQDINQEFDDIVTGLRIGTPIYTNKKNVIDIAASVGMYIPTNDFYNASTLVYSGFIAYKRFIGKTQKHSLLLNLGYQYGEKDYKQQYNNSDIYVATTGSFKVSPINFSVGYGYHF